MAVDIMELVRKKKADIAASSGRREKTVRPKMGKNRYRILPGWRKSDPTFWHDFGAHYVKDSSGEIKAVYVCTNHTFGRDCEVCDSLENAMRSATSDETLNILKEAKASKRVLVNALDLGSDNPSTPVIFELSPTVFEQILGIMDEFENIVDPDNGMDIIIDRSGAGLNTKYAVVPSAKSSKVPKAVLTALHNLDAYVAQENEEMFRKTLASLGKIAGSSALTTRAASGLLSGPLSSPTTDDPEVGSFSDSDGIIEVSAEEVEHIAPASRKAASAATPPAPKSTSKTTPPPGFDEELGDVDVDALLADI